MRPVLVCGLLFLFVYGCVAPPVTEHKKKKHDKENAQDNEIEEQAFDVEYKRYLQEVVNILEKDVDFKTRLEKADPEDIKSGKIAKDIEFVNHNVRSKLDELKRQELERLRQLAMRQYEHDNGIDRKHMKIPAHLDSNNPHTFEAEDLRKLILQTTKDLEEADRKRKEEFKEYEMHKELEYQEQLKKLDEKNRAAAEKQHEELLKKHKDHKPLHHPGSKPQLEEVWEEQDHLSPEDFNPKTFFHLHDLDGNGYWDANEVKALFKKELDKMYDPNAPEDDMKERMEEMERMREHVFNETDQDKDQLISFKEFLDQTKKQEFEKDEGWEPLDQHQQYTPEEYQQYARTHEDEIRRMIEQGLIPPAPPGYVPVILPPGAQLPPGAHLQGHPPQLVAPGAHHGSQLQQGHHDSTTGHHMPPPGMHPNAIPQGQGYHPQDHQQMQHMQAQQQAYQQQLAAAQQGQLHYQQTGGIPQQQQQHLQQQQYQQHQQPVYQQQPHQQAIAGQQQQLYNNHPNAINQQVPLQHDQQQHYQQQPAAVHQQQLQQGVPSSPPSSLGQHPQVPVPQPHAIPQQQQVQQQQQHAIPQQQQQHVPQVQQNAIPQQQQHVPQQQQHAIPPQQHVPMQQQQPMGTH